MPTIYRKRQVRRRPKRRFVLSKVAGIAFDAASNSGYQSVSSSYSWSHTCTGSDRFLAVDVSLLSAGNTVSGITYNGVALSLIGARSTVTSFGRVECWGLANPASGSNTIAVTLSGSSNSAGVAVSYTGVHQTTPTEAFASAQATNVGAADATVTVTTVADNDWAHGAIATSDTAVTAGQTTRNNVSDFTAGSGANEDTGPKTPAGTQAMAYTDVGAAATWAIGAYGIRPVAAAAGTTPGSGTAAGTSTAAGSGRSRIRAVASSAGVGAATGISRRRFEAFGTAAGTSLPTAAARSRVRALGSSAGVGTAIGSGRSRFEAFGTAAGIGAATGVGPTGRLRYGRWRRDGDRSEPGEDSGSRVRRGDEPQHGRRGGPYSRVRHCGGHEYRERLRSKSVHRFCRRNEYGAGFGAIPGRSGRLVRR